MRYLINIQSPKEYLEKTQVHRSKNKIKLNFVEIISTYWAQLLIFFVLFLKYAHNLQISKKVTIKTLFLENLTLFEKFFLPIVKSYKLTILDDSNVDWSGTRDNIHDSK